MVRITTDRKFLESMTTQRLLKYKNSLLTVPEGPNWDNERGGRGQINKSQERWQICYALVKEVLSGREHVEGNCGKEKSGTKSS